jgi:hypothetical protein
MTNAYKKYYPTDPAPSSVRDLVENTNEGQSFVPLTFPLVGSGANVSQLVSMVVEDVVVDDIEFCSDIPLMEDTQIMLESYDSWNAGTLGGTGTCLISWRDFSVDNINAFYAVSMKDTKAFTKYGSFPFVAKKGTFLIMNIQSAETADMLPTATVALALLKDHVTMPPSIPKAPINKIQRAH